MAVESLYDGQLVMRDYKPHVVSYYYKEWKDFDMAFHSHPAVEIMYVLHGDALVETLDGLFHLKKGDCILIDSRIPHRLSVTNDRRCRMINVEFIFNLANEDRMSSMRELVRDEAVRNFLMSQQPYYVLKDSQDAYQILRNLVIELDVEGEEGNLMAGLLLSQLILRMARMIRDEGQFGQGKFGSYIRSAITFLHHNYDRPLKISDVASAVNLHPGYLQRIFKDCLGTTMTEYLTELRMKKAKQLLLQTDIPITDLCAYVGMNSSQYFSAVFKKSTGQTPTEYRVSTVVQK